jgi:hypothetical protein
VELELDVVVVVEGGSEGRSPCDEDDMQAIGMNGWRTHCMRIADGRRSEGVEARDGAGMLKVEG